MKAFFLDRDGVINESHWVNNPEEFVLIEGAAEAIKLLNDYGYEVFVVTNQGGVGLGYMSEEALDTVHRFMIEQIKNTGGKIKEVKACIHKPHEGCYCRKPKPGMILDLIKSYQIDGAQSYMVGDRDVDIQAGKKAGVRTVFIGHHVPRHVQPDYVFPSLYEAVNGLKVMGVI